MSCPSMQGLEVVQPGLEPVPFPSWRHSWTRPTVLAELKGSSPRSRAREYSRQYDDALAKEGGGGGKVYRVGRRTFWLIIALAVVVVVVVGVGVGLGVGLTREKDSSAVSSSSTASSSSSSSTSTLSNTSTLPNTSTISNTASVSSSASSTSTSTSSAATATVSSVCPSANDTTVSPSLGTVTYRILCNHDFSGSGKETLASVVLSSFDDCLSLCNTMNYFQSRTDVGCTYNVEGTGGQTPGTCWCLGGSNKTIVINEGNDIAAPIDS
ncbi:hypothetical protein ASPZODRAFT_20533 [Penicilliopsis zonata CBS 506.65]|uniref:Apple domain-containing protein n=1 Tax=Penicilliopsis zonata CBS 506.65 TaxID=1073090 RepID=A0A1L9S5H1_9EURO|nr:hypothetical protein ASPZODRAFT_20533 [Penicilliopsis zonata CBS 506.65]OJJ42416.1 hypothetical protein ASPZODRAFT_20533 [Penicilliopsis zonata CBS 506.65]